MADKLKLLGYSFLYRIHHRNIHTPLCICTADIQTPYHCLLECSLVANDIRQELKREIEEFFEDAGTPDNTDIHDHITLLNTSRNRVIVELMLKAIQSNKDRYRTKIILRSNTATSNV